MRDHDDEPPLTTAQLANEVRLLDRLLARHEMPLAARHALLEVRDRVSRELAVTEVVTRARRWIIERKKV